MNESGERIAKIRAKQEFLEEAIPPGYYQSLFSNIELDEKRTGDESILTCI